MHNGQTTQQYVVDKQTIQVQNMTAESSDQMAKERLEEAMRQLRNVLRDAEREISRDRRSTAEAAVAVRHAIVWGLANMDHSLHLAEKYDRDAQQARAVAAALTSAE